MEKLKEKLEEVEGDLVEMEAQYESACLEAQERGKKIFDLSKKTISSKNSLEYLKHFCKKLLIDIVIVLWRENAVITSS